MLLLLRRLALGLKELAPLHAFEESSPHRPSNRRRFRTLRPSRSPRGLYSQRRSPETRAARGGVEGRRQPADAAGYSVGVQIRGVGPPRNPPVPLLGRRGEGELTLLAAMCAWQSWCESSWVARAAFPPFLLTVFRPALCITSRRFRSCAVVGPIPTIQQYRWARSCFTRDVRTCFAGARILDQDNV